MKKLTFSIFTILILALTACNGASGAQQVSPSQSTNTSPDEMSLASKLVIGSFKLEGTDNAITVEQAAELLPLWQVYQRLSTSDAAAQEEITALVEQIQETMTADQMTAINAMNLVPQDIFTVMQEQGITGQDGRTFNQGEPSTGGNGAFPAPPEGFVPGGGPGGGQGGGPGGFGGGQGQGLSPEQIATAQARRAENGGGFGNRMLIPLIEAVIELLESK